MQTSPSSESTPQFPPGNAAGAFAALGALYAAVAVATSAYASHGLEGHARDWGLLAAIFLFGHGVALPALAWTPLAKGRLGAAALGLLALGAVLFSGSLIAGALFGLGTRLAPFGGGLLMLGWLLCATAALRKQ